MHEHIHSSYLIDVAHSELVELLEHIEVEVTDGAGPDGDG